MNPLTPIITKNINGGFQKIYRFENGYGASVVNHNFSYGLELAVIIFYENSDRFKLCYDTEITSDVIGYLTENKLNKLLKDIENLPKIKPLKVVNHE